MKTQLFLRRAILRAVRALYRPFAFMLPSPRSARLRPARSLRPLSLALEPLGGRCHTSAALASILGLEYWAPNAMGGLLSNATPFATGSADGIWMSLPTIPNMAGASTDTFRMRWSGQIAIDTPGTYYFQIPQGMGANFTIGNTNVVYSASWAGDMNGDGQVDATDVALEQNSPFMNDGLANYTWNQGDFTGDGYVDDNDLALVSAIGQYGQGVVTVAGRTAAGYPLDNATVDYSSVGGPSIGIPLTAGTYNFTLDYYRYHDPSNSTPAPTASLKWATSSTGPFTGISTGSSSAALAVTPLPIEVPAGTSFSGTIATFKYGNSSPPPASSFVVTRDWGDGTTDSSDSGASTTYHTLAITAVGDGSYKVTGSHTYSSNGNYTTHTTVTYTPTSTSSHTLSGTARVYGGPVVAADATAQYYYLAGTSTPVSVLGAAPAGEPSLSYSWTASSEPNGAPDPFLSPNGTNAAKNANATFFRAGTYTLRATISDGAATDTSDTQAVVQPVLASLFATPASATLANSGTYKLSALALDQFSNPLSTQPAITWSAASGQGTVNSTTGVYTAPSTGSGPFTVTASATVNGHTVTKSVTLNIGTSSSTSQVPNAVTDLLAQDGGDGSVQLVWSAATTGPAADGYLIESSSDGGSTFAPIGIAAAGQTQFLANGDAPNMPYVFRVTPFDSTGQGTPTTSDSITIDSAPAANWYKVGLDDPNNPTATSEDFTLNTTAYSDTGTLSLTAAAQASGGWVQANSAADAVRQALTGTFHSAADDTTVTFPSSGAFEYNPSFDRNVDDSGPAVVVEDLFNFTGHGDADFDDAYAPITIVGDQVWTNATTADQSQAQPGYTVVGTFRDADLGAAASNFSALVTWADHTTSTGTITPATDSSFIVSVVVPSGESTTNYSLTITHTPTGVNTASGTGTMTPPPPPVVAVPFSASATAVPKPSSVGLSASLYNTSSQKPVMGISWVNKGDLPGTVYQIYRSGGGSGTKLIGSLSTDPNQPIPTTPLFYPDFFVQPGTKYTYQVEAVYNGTSSGLTKGKSPAKMKPASVTPTPGTLTVKLTSATDTSLSETVAWNWAGSNHQFELYQSTGVRSLGNAIQSPTLTPSSGVVSTPVTVNFGGWSGPTSLAYDPPVDFYTAYAISGTGTSLRYSFPSNQALVPQVFLIMGGGNGQTAGDNYRSNIVNGTGGFEPHIFAWNPSQNAQFPDATHPIDGAVFEHTAQPVMDGIAKLGPGVPVVLAGVSYGGGEAVRLVNGEVFDQAKNRYSYQVNADYLALFDPVAPLSDPLLPGDTGNGSGVESNNTGSLFSPPYLNSNTNNYIANNPDSVFTLPSTLTKFDNWWVPFALNYYDANSNPVNGTPGQYFGFAEGYVGTPTTTGNHMAQQNLRHGQVIGDYSIFSANPSPVFPTSAGGAPVAKTFADSVNALPGWSF